MADLLPGKYELTAKAEGFRSSSPTNVLDNPSVSVDVPLGSTTRRTLSQWRIFKRFIQAYANDWKGTAESALLISSIRRAVQGWKEPFFI